MVQHLGGKQVGRWYRLVGGTGRWYNTWDTMENQVLCDATLEATAAVAFIKTTRSQETTTRFLWEKQESRRYVKKQYQD